MRSRSRSLRAQPRAPELLVPGNSRGRDKPSVRRYARMHHVDFAMRELARRTAAAVDCEDMHTVIARGERAIEKLCPVRRPREAADRVAPELHEFPRVVSVRARY